VRALTARQERFIEEYPVDLNATRAAIRAGYSPKTAFVTGYQNLQKELVRAAVRRKLEEAARRIGVTTDQVLRELSAIAFSNIGDYLDWGRGPSPAEVTLYKAMCEMLLVLHLPPRRRQQRRKTKGDRQR
jgi:hypothetical protein